MRDGYFNHRGTEYFHGGLREFLRDLCVNLCDSAVKKEI